MARSKKKTGGQVTGEWMPLRRGTPNPQLVAVRAANGIPEPDGVWFNDVYQVIEQRFESGLTHLSIKRNDRHIIRDWRHLQAIKNEVCGPERVGVEVFPPESKLVDTANEYHMWVLPADHDIPFGFDESLVSSDYQVKEFNSGRERGDHKGRQRPFQPGLPVARGRNDQEDARVPLSQTAKLPQRVRA